MATRMTATEAKLKAPMVLASLAGLLVVLAGLELDEDAAGGAPTTPP